MSCRARRTTHRSSWGASPLSSATVTKVPGDTGPRSGCVQRARASMPTTAPDRRSTMGWYSRCNASCASAAHSSVASAYRCSTSSPSVGSKTCTRSRPALFAACTAVSAWRSRSTAETAGSAGATATPMDAVRCTVASSTRKGSATASRRQRASACAWRSSVSSQTTANSSSPQRATVCRRDTAARRRASTPHSSRSPRSCPREALTILKRSRSTIRTAVERSALDRAHVSRSRRCGRSGCCVGPSWSAAARGCCSARGP